MAERSHSFDVVTDIGSEVFESMTDSKQFLLTDFLAPAVIQICH